MSGLTFRMSPEHPPGFFCRGAACSPGFKPDVERELERL